MRWKRKLDESLFGESGSAGADKRITLDRTIFLDKLSSALNHFSIKALKSEVQQLKSALEFPSSDLEGLLRPRSDADLVSFKASVLLSELDQILEAQTIERAKYYIERLVRTANGARTGRINDIDLNRWKEYDEIITDSLWVLDKRDKSGVHVGWYWGNFIPQIPRQLMLRYTKRGEWVVDAFVGSGTTLIECRKLGRNGIGVELIKDVAEVAEKHSQEENNPFSVTTRVFCADSRTVDVPELLKNVGIKKYQLLIMHPPYHDIIPFSRDERDLSNAPSVPAFLQMFGEVVENFAPHLERGRYLGLVIGDKYSQGEWIPLGYRCMEEVLKRNFTLKSIVVKNFDFTRGKRNQQELWRYRALVGGFYVFKHEYVMIFRKK